MGVNFSIHTTSPSFACLWGHHLLLSCRIFNSLRWWCERRAVNDTSLLKKKKKNMDKRYKKREKEIQPMKDEPLLLVEITFTLRQLDLNLGWPVNSWASALWASTNQEGGTVVSLVSKKWRNCLLLSVTHTGILFHCFLIVSWHTSGKKRGGGALSFWGNLVHTRVFVVKFSPRPPVPPSPVPTIIFFLAMLTPLYLSCCWWGWPAS